MWAGRGWASRAECPVPRSSTSVDRTAQGQVGRLPLRDPGISHRPRFLEHPGPMLPDSHPPGVPRPHHPKGQGPEEG